MNLENIKYFYTEIVKQYQAKRSDKRLTTIVFDYLAFIESIFYEDHEVMNSEKRENLKKYLELTKKFSNQADPVVKLLPDIIKDLETNDEDLRKQLSPKQGESLAIELRRIQNMDFVETRNAIPLKKTPVNEEITATDSSTSSTYEDKTPATYKAKIAVDEALEFKRLNMLQKAIDKLTYAVELIKDIKESEQTKLLYQRYLSLFKLQLAKSLYNEDNKNLNKITQELKDSAALMEPVATTFADRLQLFETYRRLSGTTVKNCDEAYTYIQKALSIYRILKLPMFKEKYEKCGIHIESEMDLLKQQEIAVLFQIADKLNFTTDDSLSKLLEAINIYETHFQNTDKKIETNTAANLLVCWSAIAFYFKKKGDLDKAVETLNYSLKFFKQIDNISEDLLADYNENAELVIELLTQKAQSLCNKQEYEKATINIKQALDLAKSLNIKDLPEHLKVKSELKYRLDTCYRTLALIYSEEAVLLVSHEKLLSASAAMQEIKNKTPEDFFNLVKNQMAIANYFVFVAKDKNAAEKYFEFAEGYLNQLPVCEELLIEIFNNQVLFYLYKLDMYLSFTLIEQADHLLEKQLKPYIDSHKHLIHEKQNINPSLFTKIEETFSEWSYLLLSQNKCDFALNKLKEAMSLLGVEFFRYPKISRLLKMHETKNNTAHLSLFGSAPDLKAEKTDENEILISDEQSELVGQILEDGSLKLADKDVESEEIDGERSPKRQKLN